MKRTVFLFFLLLLSACAANPLPRTLGLERQPRLGIVGFKVTAPIKKLSSILEEPPKNLSQEDEASLVSNKLRDIEDRAAKFLAEDLNEAKAIEPVLIPDGIFGTHRGERPTPAQMEMLRKEYGVDAVFYGDIPWYGKTRLIYPVLGESLDIAAESLIIGFATGWDTALIFGNIGFELLTSTPIWFGGAYVFGWAFRPVTVEAWAVSAENNVEIWHRSVDRIVSKKILKTYPEPEQSRKEVQLEASLRKAIRSIADSLSR